MTLAVRRANLEHLAKAHVTVAPRPACPPVRLPAFGSLSQSVSGGLNGTLMDISVHSLTGHCDTLPTTT